ncbi:MAG: AmmeMemoRadiSam system protein B [Candidatus Aminicenantes bacterium]|nr:MAG: AmmeMemoRadiSam system protein B [Candidatus Aminicenantes bacterium]
MRKKIVPFVLLILFSVLVSWPQGLRKAQLAGSWYPKDPEALARLIDHFLKNVPLSSIPSGDILAIIAPHAGYVYSGQVAAYAYKSIQKKNYESVVILAPSHQWGFEGCSIYPNGGYETPFGISQVDAFLAAEISKATGFGFIAQAHQAEHSIEIQVPFVQRILPKAKIVPIVIGVPKRATITSLAEGLKKATAGKNVLVIASTDLSHYLTKKEANKKDNETITLIRQFKTSELIRKCERRENIMCGGGPVVAALLFAKDKAGVEILRYSDSSEASQDESRVVGYLAAALFAKPVSKEFRLSEQEKKELLQLAYSTVNLYVKENKVQEYKPQGRNLLQNCGAFVTLKKHGQLRGCIGFIEPVLPLHQAVMQASVYAACRDSRFLPVTRDELDDLKVEISVLTPLKKIVDPKRITVGRHGLVIAKDGKRGLLLPQVALEQKWNRESFLENTCLKAGLPKDAWRTGAEIFVFEAIIFH